MKSRSAYDKQIINSVTDVLRFGKYKGQTVEFVIHNDPGYLLWCHDEKVAKVSEKILDMADEADTEDRFAEAMDGELRGMSYWEFIRDDA